MKKLIHHHFLLLLLLSTMSLSSVFSQSSSIELESLLSGTKFACIELTEEEQYRTDNNQFPMIEAFAEYLQNLGFEDVAYTSTDKTKLMLQVSTLCDIAKIRLDFVYENNIIKDSRIRFRSCQQHEIFMFNRVEVPTDLNLYANLTAVWNKMYQQPINYNSANRLQLPKNKSTVNEMYAKEILANPSIPTDFIEGIYQKKPTYGYTAKQHKIAILKSKGGSYHIYYLDGISNFLDWEEGEVMGSLPKGSSLYEYNDVNWITSNKLIQDKGKIVFVDDNNFILTFDGHPHTYEYERILPTAPLVGIDPVEAVISEHEQLDMAVDFTKPLALSLQENLSNSYYLSSTGSAIAVSQDGYIVTNYHVVANHEYIEVMIPNTRYKVSYRAIVVSTDEDSDLALLKIEDANFTQLPTIPYYFRYREADVGENVFTLGFPMVESMGWDIKLTDGLISSRKGYQDDPKTYQVSVPVNPGNSGGPLFSEDGELVGIIKAKHSNADNVSYALKTSNILSLINESGVNFPLPNNNYLKNKSMSDQVKDLEAFVFWVKAFKTK
ncbi:MAG: serine protease [Chitinophagales bacterium]